MTQGNLIDRIIWTFFASLFTTYVMMGWYLMDTPRKSEVMSMIKSNIMLIDDGQVKNELSRIVLDQKQLISYVKNLEKEVRKLKQDMQTISVLGSYPID